MSLTIRHGYYIAHDDSLHGDSEFSGWARNVWKDHPCSTLSKRHIQTRRYDGVSLFTREDGVTVCRLIVQNIFDEGFRVQIIDL